MTATREQLIGCPKSQNVVKHMTNQIDKAIRKADSRLKELKENSKQLKSKLDTVASATVHPTSDLQQLLQGKAHREMAAVLRQHRQQLSGVQAVSLLGLVTKLLSRADAEYHIPQAKKALLDEALKLVLRGVWSEKAESKSKMAKEFENAVFSRLFPILGIKNFDTEDPTYKSRIVIQGSNMKDGQGESVFFHDTSSAPTSTACVRSTVGYGCLHSDPDPTKDGTASVADAEQAYI